MRQHLHEEQAVVHPRSLPSRHSLNLLNFTPHVLALPFYISVFLNSFSLTGGRSVTMMIQTPLLHPMHRWLWSLHLHLHLQREKLKVMTACIREYTNCNELYIQILNIIHNQAVAFLALSLTLALLL